ncbi:MAG TPA: arsenate reductase ArsC [Acidobacteriota bacterium]|nr:arsenate reductase ArsC [Acidobacteriota bacterium]
MARKPRILFVCTGNSARSQMAEGFTRYYAGSTAIVDSAGTDPVGINPYAKWAMNEAGIDIDGQTSDALAEMDLSSFDYVITLCGDARDRCPAIPPDIRTEHWDLPDPAGVRGRPSDVIQAFRVIRFEIERRVRDLLTRILQPQS